MNKQQTELNKLRMLLNAIDTKDETKAPDFVQELKDIAFKVVIENPGIKRPEWIDILMSEYPGEIIDAYGPTFSHVHTQLTMLWDSFYIDPITEDRNTFAQWSVYLNKHPEESNKYFNQMNYESS